MIGRAIESLLTQNYPSDKFEIIVVDDGSTDHTGAIIQGYSRVKYLMHPQNQGVATARNTGLWQASGQIYASFDDDCVVGPDWLIHLAQGYEMPDIAGVASTLVSPDKIRGLADHYMVATGSGNPTHVKTNARNHWTKRLLSYVADHLRIRSTNSEEIYPVGLISGASASFPIAVLKAVGGWEPAMSGVEDTDLCHRISLRFPSYVYYAVKSAQMIHDPKLSVKQLLNRQLSRGPINLAYYRKFNLTPPIFPFPMAWLGLTVVALLLVPGIAYLVALLLPMMLYIWWPVRSLRERRPIYLLFPYLQMSEELSAMLGMTRDAATSTSKRFLQPLPLAVALTGLWAALTILAPPNLAMNIFTVFFLLLVPGLLLLRIIVPAREPGQIWSTISYATGLSVISLMLTGLAINTLLPLAGYYQPLSRRPLVLSISLLVLALVAILGRRTPNISFNVHIPRPTMPEAALALLGTLLPVMSVLGAISLNNGGTGSITSAMLAGVAIYTLALLWPRDGRVRFGFAYGLYSIGLSLLLATSMRGWYITGHDIMQEYQVFQLTTQHSLWSMRFYQDAYTACLSITILPTIMAKLTSIADPYIYKTIFQGIFALVPVILFQTLTPYVSKRIAFLAAFIFISFPTFMVDMPMLARQEIAFLCFALAFMALFSQKLTQRQKSLMIAIMLIGTVLSHYSTSYVALGVILAAKGLEIVYQLWRRLYRKRTLTKTNWMPLRWPLIIVMLLTTYLWNTQLTHTSTSIASTISGAVTNLPQILNHSSKTGEAAYSLVGAKTTPEELFSIFNRTSVTRRDLNSSYYYPGSVTNLYPVTMASDTIQAPTPVGQWLESHRVALFSFYDNSRQGYAKLVQVLMVLGSIILLFSRKLFRMPVQYSLMGLAFLAVIALQVLLPSSVINYGLLRLIQQGLLFLGLPIVLAALSLPRLLRVPPNASLRLVAAGFIGLFIILSGLAPAISGGYKPALTTSNSGFYYDAYYTHADELAGLAWLKQHAPAGAIVDADEFARRKMITYAGIFARPHMTPDTIVVNAYVFLSHADITTNKIPIYVNGTLLYQTVPTAFLIANKTLVYSNQHVEIYR